MARATEAFGIPAFRRVFVSNMAFFMAMGGQGIVRPWIAFQLTDSALALGIVSSAMAIPMLVLSPFGGVLADRVERRRLILGAQSLALVTESLVFFLLVTDRIEFWHLVLSAASIGICLPLMMPARTAILFAIVGRRGLGAAMGLNMTGMNATRVLGPATAGWLIATVEVEGAYGFGLVLYATALVAMLRVPRLPAPPGAGDVSVLSNLGEGFAYLGRDRLVAILLAFGLVPQFLAMPFLSILPAFAERVWSVGPTGFGTLNAAVGVGAVCGSLYVASRAGDRARLRAMMIAAIAFGALLFAFAASPYFWPAVGLVLLANVGASVFQTLNNVAIQLVIPDAVRGRVSSFLMMSVSLPMLGALPMGAAAERYGAPAAVSVAALAAVVLAIGFYLASPQLRRLDERVGAELAREG